MGFTAYQHITAVLRRWKMKDRIQSQPENCVRYTMYQCFKEKEQELGLFYTFVRINLIWCKV